MRPGVGIEGFEDVAFQAEDGHRGWECGEKEDCDYGGGEGAQGGVGPHGAARQQQHDEELNERALFVDGVHHFEVEHRRFVEAAGGVVEKDEGVLEEPGIDDQAEGDADEPGFEGQCQEQGKDDYDGHCSAPRGSQEVTQQAQGLGANGRRCGVMPCDAPLQYRCLEYVRRNAEICAPPT